MRKSNLTITYSQSSKLGRKKEEKREIEEEHKDDKTIRGTFF